LQPSGRVDHVAEGREVLDFLFADVPDECDPEVRAGPNLETEGRGLEGREQRSRLLG
jgi:hypothetical protein